MEELAPTISRTHKTHNQSQPHKNPSHQITIKITKQTQSIRHKTQIIRLTVQKECPLEHKASYRESESSDEAGGGVADEEGVAGII
jgi:hypothetical protein